MASMTAMSQHNKTPPIRNKMDHVHPEHEASQRRFQSRSDEDMSVKAPEGLFQT